MRNPAASDDDWDDLARELGVDKSAPPPLPPEPHAPDMVERQVEAEIVEPHHGLDDRVEDEAVAEGEPEAAIDEEFTEGEEGAVEGEPATEGQPGTGRKRRRRRRRRRKGGAPAEAGAGAEVGEGEPAEAGEEEAEGAAAIVNEAADEFATEDEEFATEDEVEFAPLGAEEDTASDVLRDLIANWNVPSWDDIVGGLYRPER
jgi:ribonuclease E